MQSQSYPPRVVAVRHRRLHAAPAHPLPMATPRPVPAPDLPAVILWRPSWLDLPATTLLWRCTLAGLAALPALLLLTATLRVAWRLL